MTFSDIASIGNYILISLGGAAVVILAFSSWLGKVWADRLMRNEKNKHDIQLEELKDSLAKSTQTELSSIRTQLEIEREALIRDHTDRVTIYRSVIDIVTGVAAKLEMIILSKRGPLTTEELHEFETLRLKAYAYLAMHAPQSVMDAHDAMFDVLLSIVFDGKTVTWPDFRNLSTNFLNAVRKDIGIRTEPIYYRGNR